MCLTDAQKRAIRWLDRCGGSGVIDRYGRFLAGGETNANQATMLRLLQAGLLVGVNGRIVLQYTREVQEVVDRS